MFEEDDEINGGVDKDLNRFNVMYDRGEYGYFDSDRIEALIDHLIITNQLEKAKWASEKAINQFPFNSIFELRFAQILSLEGKIKEAYEIFKKIEKSESDNLNVDLFLSLASTYSQMQYSRRAISYFYKALELANFDEKPDIYVDIAVEFSQNNELEKAIIILEQAIEAYVDNESILFELVYCYEQKGYFQKAIDCYIKYIDENPYSYTAWYNLGNSYLKISSFEKALEAYDYCLVINEKYVPAYFNTANTYVELGKYERAIEFYQKCIGFDGDESITFCSIGECYEELGQYNEALLYYDKSIELIPHFADAWLGKGVVLDALGNVEESLLAVEKAIELDNTQPSYYHIYANFLDKIDAINDARLNYEKAIALSKEEDENLIIDYLKFIGNNFREELFEIIENDNYLRESESVNLFLINEFWNQNNFKKALKILDQMLAKDSNQVKKLFLHFEDLTAHEEIRKRLQS